ncbi:hypothetical protein HF086_013001 [Spodoptera exigua]|uniref:Uncharacterized protein n=1 Tax=Spodoptera exigua TaxID=7107 RepID=A0A922MQR7_SPOEX|nr:hypothetical protein HF086_013001 [Spodoptera exigua]
MPKRKICDDNYEHLLNKLKNIEEELRRHQREQSVENPIRRRRIRVISTSSSSEESTLSEKHDNEVSAQPPKNTVVDCTRGTECSNIGNTMDIINTVETAGSALAANDAETKDATLDIEVLEILGIDPTTPKNYGNNIQKDVAVRLEHNAIEGLSRENRNQLLNTYLVSNNCKLIGAPVLNPELKAALSEPVIKRDKAIEAKQKVTAAAIACLGQVISLTISSKEKDTNLLRLLMDTSRMLCDCQHSDTLTRRNYVISSIKKDMKESLLSAKTDTFLFGDKLPDTLKAAKAINKSGAELKIATTPKPGPSKKFTTSASTSKNWKTNPPLRKTAPAVTKETTTRNRRGNSSKTSRGQHHSRR